MRTSAAHNSLENAALAARVFAAAIISIIIPA